MMTTTIMEMMMMQLSKKKMKLSKMFQHHHLHLLQKKSKQFPNPEANNSRTLQDPVPSCFPSSTSERTDESFCPPHPHLNDQPPQRNRPHDQLSQLLLSRRRQL